MKRNASCVRKRVFPFSRLLPFCLSRFYKHVAPLGFGCMVASVFYKHTAPLGLKALVILVFPFSASLRPLCLCGE